MPDTEDFSQRKVRETATAVPSGYRPPDVGIAAMLHTKPKLTWDAEDEGRKKMLHKRVSKDELRDDDFKVATFVAVRDRLHDDTEVGRIVVLHSQCRLRHKTVSSAGI